MQANGARRPVSRVLSASVLDTGRPFLWDAPHGAPHATNPDGEAGMPPGIRRALAGAAVPIRSCSRWGLPCRPCCQGRGALLPHRFALARGAPYGMPRGAAWGPCAGGLFSVALSLGSPPPAVGRHRIPVEPGLSSAAPESSTGGDSGRPAVWHTERCAGGGGASSGGSRQRQQRKRRVCLAATVAAP